MSRTREPYQFNMNVASSGKRGSFCFLIGGTSPLAPSGFASGTTVPGFQAPSPLPRPPRPSGSAFRARQLEETREIPPILLFWLALHDLPDDRQPFMLFLGQLGQFLSHQSGAPSNRRSTLAAKSGNSHVSATPASGFKNWNFHFSRWGECQVRR